MTLLEIYDDGSGACVAVSLTLDGPMREVFLRQAPWTRCFVDRHHITWATDHRPAVDVHDPDSSIIVHLGNVDNNQAEHCVYWLLARPRAGLSWAGVARRFAAAIANSPCGGELQ
jgi:hypothetical protein